MTKEQATQAAGAKLDQLNETMNKVLVAAVACASMLTVLTAIACYGAFEYLRIKSALGEAQAKLSDSLKSMPSRPFPPIRKD
ncbi:MAG: hypothetical protein U0790_25330 [Isosphaeraceae bacterium]